MSKQTGSYRNPRFLPILFFAAALVISCVSSAHAQTTGTLTGKVSDPSGGVLAGARVTARHIETGMTRNTVTGPEGRFLIAGLPAGNYEVRAEFTGFRPLVRSGVTLTINETLGLDFVLAVGELDQAITVAGQSPLVNTHSAGLSYLVSESAIRELPLNGRNYTQLALLQPGVLGFVHRDGGSVVAHGLGMSINGQDPRSNVYLIDGTPQNDFTNGPAGSAAGTALGVETIREFRVETNAYSAEFGRNSGGQINALTKSGTNDFHGSLYEYFRNDNFDARNYFDPAKKPAFVRNQFGVTGGGPLRRDNAFLFVGYEGLRERLGRTVATIVPDNNARMGMLAAAAQPCALTNVGVTAAVQPYLSEFPVASGTNILNTADCPTGLANHSFPFRQVLDEDFGQVRFDQNVGANHQFFLRYTIDDAAQQLPTDFPQFPRAFISRNQFFTAQYTQILSGTTLHTARFNFARTRIGQDVEANTSQPLAPFVPGRTMVGDIDIGGVPRFGPQTSVNVQLVQNVFGGEYNLTHTRGRHLLKFGGLAERYQDNLFNPTFSLGIYTFASLQTFLQGTAIRFIGLTPNGELDRYWRFTLFGFYAQDAWRLHPRLTVNLGLRYEVATLPKEIRDRDALLINVLSDAAPTLGKVYDNPTYKNISPRIGLAWDIFGDGKTALRTGYGWYFNTNNQQNLIVTITNPPFTPRPVLANPAFPTPSFASFVDSIRPVEKNIQNPNVHIWNLSLEHQFWGETTLTVGYAGSRGVHLLRSGDVNIPTPQIQADGTPFWAAGLARPNPNFTTIELKSSDGNSWYNALLFEVRKRFGRQFDFQSSYTFSRNIDTTQASTFFSDATNGTTSAFPEFPGFNPNKGLADYHAKHNWVFNFQWHLPFARNLDGVSRVLLHGWQLGGIGTVRSGNPLTVFVQANRSRSLWSPSLAPGIGFDRPSFAPGFTHETAVLGRPDQWFDPNAFVLQPVGTFGNVGRGALIGPDLRTFDTALVKNTGFEAWGKEANVQFRAEAFNLFNRTNFGNPGLLALTGGFGIIRSTVTSSRQIQLGLRILW
jgi:hypothetical protein